MDNDQISKFANRYAALTEDDLIEIHRSRATLLPEAGAALDTELRRRGLDESALTSIDATRDRESARPPKRDKKLMAFQILGIIVVYPVAHAIARVTPHWVQFLILIAVLGYFVTKWASRTKS